MAKRIRYLTSAQHDIADISRYIGRESGQPETGRRFARGIATRCRKLASLPGSMGRPRPELGPDLRSIVFKGYVIFFPYVGDTLEVVNVLEGHRDIEAFFSDE